MVRSLFRRRSVQGFFISTNFKQEEKLQRKEHEEDFCARTCGFRCGDFHHNGLFVRNGFERREKRHRGRHRTGAHRKLFQTLRTFRELGNVYEWVYDVGDDNERIIRGGAYTTSAAACKITAWNDENPSKRMTGIGFRIARNAK